MRASVALVIVAVAAGVASSALAGAPAPSTPSPVVVADAAGDVAARIRSVLLPGWRVTRDGSVLHVAGEVTVMVPNAPSGGDVERHTYEVVVTVMPYVDEAAQRAHVDDATKRERRLWKGVEALVCDGMEFSDHYVDGLCFRTKNRAQESRVAAYRTARNALLDVPAHHLEHSASVSIRVRGPEPTDGACADCATTADRIGKLLTPYPIAPTPR